MILETQKLLNSHSNFSRDLVMYRIAQNVNQPARITCYYACNKINFVSMIQNVIMIETATGWSRRRSMRLDRGSVVRVDP